MRENYHRLLQFFFFFVVVLLSPYLLFANSNTKIQNGLCSVDITTLSQSRLVRLDGEWEFFYDKLLYSDNLLTPISNVQPDTFAHVPHYWHKTLSFFTKSKSSFGKGSYRLFINNLLPEVQYAILIIESPGTACNVFANGDKVAHTGIVSKQAAGSRPQSTPCYAEFFPNSEGIVELVIEVSNWTYRKGGLWDSVLLGEQEAVRLHYNTKSGIIHFICTMLLFLSIVNLILFILHPQKKSPLYFSLLTAIFALRLAVSGFSVLSIAWPTIPYDLQRKLEYIIIWLAPAVFLLQTISLFPQLKISRLLVKLLTIVPLVLGVVSLVLPIQYANWLVVPFQITAVVTFFILLCVVVRSLISGDHDIVPYFLTMSIAGIGLLAEIMFTSQKGILPISSTPTVMTLFSIVQFFIQSQQQSRLYSDRRHLSLRMRELNVEYSKYVPHELFTLLDCTEVITTQPGMFRKMNGTVLFLQSVVQGTEKTQFLVYSAFLTKALPIIANHQGYTATYCGTGITIIFKESPVDVIKCCFALKRLVSSFNAEQLKKDKPVLALYSAIHYGDILIGLTGNKQHSFGTAVSAAVETAFRMALYAQSVRREIVISRQAAEEATLNDSFNQTLIPLGVITLKRNHQPVQLYECQNE